MIRLEDPSEMFGNEILKVDGVEYLSLEIHTMRAYTGDTEFFRNHEVIRFRPESEEGRFTTLDEAEQYVKITCKDYLADIGYTLQVSKRRDSITIRIAPSRSSDDYFEEPNAIAVRITERSLKYLTNTVEVFLSRIESSGYASIIFRDARGDIQVVHHHDRNASLRRGYENATQVYGSRGYVEDVILGDHPDAMYYLSPALSFRTSYREGYYSVIGDTPY